jgi:uncharacterized membrane protein YkoI
MTRIFVASGIVAVALTAACSSSTERMDELRTALDKAGLSLADSVGVAEAKTEGAVAVDASLLPEASPVFRVGALASAAFQDVRINAVDGEVISVEEGTDSAPDCSGAISLAEAIGIAERTVDGDAVEVEVEDDDEGPCIREVTVLTSDTIMEVEVAADGKVLEIEDEGAEDEAEDDADDAAEDQAGGD